jgi:hypothetical protein
MATRPLWIIGDEEEDLYASACARGADAVVLSSKRMVQKFLSEKAQGKRIQILSFSDSINLTIFHDVICSRGFRYSWEYRGIWLLLIFSC